MSWNHDEKETLYPCLPTLHLPRKSLAGQPSTPLRTCVSHQPSISLLAWTIAKKQFTCILWFLLWLKRVLFIVAIKLFSVSLALKKMLTVCNHTQSVCCLTQSWWVGNNTCQVHGLLFYYWLSLYMCWLHKCSITILPFSIILERFFFLAIRLIIIPSTTIITISILTWWCCGWSVCTCHTHSEFNLLIVFTHR